MITTPQLCDVLDPKLLQKLCCPICLSNLHVTSSCVAIDSVVCSSCRAAFPVVDRLPIMLVGDKNLRQKTDEIVGEVIFNSETIPPHVHLQRNAFVNANTDAFLNEFQTRLRDDHLLIVGSSFAELQFFHQKCRAVTCLDIVPDLAKDAYEATKNRGISATWLCGDGEFLPFEDESFDCVVIRQTLHHMLNYYSAIAEFFRVCTRGGSVLVIDEPFSPPNTEDMSFVLLTNDCLVYQDIRLRKILEILDLPIEDGQMGNLIGLLPEQEHAYIEPDENSPETFLADKYHRFSLLSAIDGIRLHTDDLRLFWPRETAWLDNTGGRPEFCHGPNPLCKKSLIDRIVSPGNVSIAARKHVRTTRKRDRSSAWPIDPQNTLYQGVSQTG